MKPETITLLMFGSIIILLIMFALARRTPQGLHNQIIRLSNENEELRHQIIGDAGRIEELEAHIETISGEP